MPTTIERRIGNEKLILETGKLAPQAQGAVTVRYGETIVLVTAVMSDKPRAADIDFLPLTVDYEERLYSAGKIPGSFFRREGRPGQEATLSARLTDRSIRPLFPKGLHNDIQITITVLSADQDHPAEVLAMIGTSAALTISQIPFNGPIGATRVSYLNGDFIVNPTYQQVSTSQLSTVVASTSDAIMMVESASDQVSEEIILKGIQQAHEANQSVIDMIAELASHGSNPKVEVPDDSEEAEALDQRIKGILNSRLAALLEENAEKMPREEGEARLEAEVAEQLADQYPPAKIAEGFKNVLKYEVRRRILEQGIRPDGRTLTEIRPISCEVGVLPRTHGSGLFTRGLTQVLSTVTLGSMSMKQILDTVGPEDTKRFMHHYNFPSFSTGEARRVGSPGRREIGHGALAERAILPALPSEEEFPYTIRVVSEVLSSNGSTSMGSVCGTTLALKDAGVPIKDTVAGIAMGLITNDNGEFAVLSDIQGVEDFLGDMDFKVAGTANGINALQMDIKLTGLTQDILSEALEQARLGRLFILDKMNEAISQPRGQMSPYAPKMIRMQIPVEKIGAVIGPGGRVIRAIIEETGASIDVADDGAVTIGSSEQAMLDLAQSRIDNLTRELVVGDILTGKVTRLTNFGAFIELLPGREGLLRNEDLGEMEGELDIDDELTVMVQEIDNLGRLNLSRRALFGDNGGGAPSPSPRPQAPRQPSFDRGGGGRSGPGGPPRGGGMGGGRGGPGGPRPGGGGGRSGPGGGRGGPGGPRPGGGGGRSGPGGGRGGPGGPRPGGGGGRSGPGGPPRSGGGGMADRRFLGGSGGRGR
jgi:polyribonucleotide nucleotidyltransferase